MVHLVAEPDETLAISVCANSGPRQQRELQPLIQFKHCGHRVELLAASLTWLQRDITQLKLTNIFRTRKRYIGRGPISNPGIASPAGANGTTWP